MSPAGRIQEGTVTAEITRLQRSWGQAASQTSLLDQIDGLDRSTIDEFDQRQLEHVIEVCRQSKSLAEAGRKLFNVSRLAKKQPNDSDRLRKYLAKFGLSFPDITD